MQTAMGDRGRVLPCPSLQDISPPLCALLAPFRWIFEASPHKDLQMIQIRLGPRSERSAQLVKERIINLDHSCDIH